MDSKHDKSGDVVSCAVKRQSADRDLSDLDVIQDFTAVLHETMAVGVPLLCVYATPVGECTDEDPPRDVRVALRNMRHREVRLLLNKLVIAARHAGVLTPGQTATIQRIVG